MVPHLTKSVPFKSVEPSDSGNRFATRSAYEINFYASISQSFFCTFNIISISPLNNMTRPYY